MNLTRTRYALIWIFIVFLAMQLGCLFIARGRMWPEEFTSIVQKLLATYAAQLGLVLGAVFAKQKASTGNPQLGLSWVALILAIIWNLLLAARTISFSLAQQDSIADLIKYFDTVGPAGAFLVAGAIAYFFGKAGDGIPSNE